MLVLLSSYKHPHIIFLTLCSSYLVADTLIKTKLQLTKLLNLGVKQQHLLSGKKLAKVYKPSLYK